MAEPGVYGEGLPEDVQAQLEDRERLIDDLDERLADFGVHAGFGEARREMASELAQDGLQSAELDLLGQHAKAHAETPQAASARLAWRLAEPERWRELLGDLRRAESARIQRSAAPQESDCEPGRIDRECDMSRKPVGEPDYWREQELDRHLLAVWRGDLRGDPERVGEAGKRLGVSVDRVIAGISRQLADEGIEGGVQGWVAKVEADRKRVRRSLASARSR